VLLAGVSGYALLLGILGGSSLGLLRLNWSPSVAFIGDVGSGFLVFVLVGIALIGGVGRPVEPLLLVLPLSPFLVDATMTLARRAWRREVVWAPHREHLCQRLILHGLGHAPVAVAYGPVQR
jgi:UDP-N-acetylmuramyl pentapeptide phosphotransferase/UDP-N-acetylglucosamine-1-phosphate transferase